MLQLFGNAKKSVLEYGVIYDSGKYIAYPLSLYPNESFPLYISRCTASSAYAELFIVDADKNELKLNNSWTQRSLLRWGCLYFTGYTIDLKMILGKEVLKIVLCENRECIYSDLINLVLGIAENCKTITEAKIYSETYLAL